jgi:lysozyme family protein
MIAFEKAFKDVVMLEGGYVDNPYDSGGKTKYGITEEVARKHHYKGGMKDFTKPFAKHIYKVDYWDPLYLDEVAAVSRDVALELFDSCVNMGPDRATDFLQRSLNVLNVRERVYDDLTLDGVMGPATLSALRKHVEHRGSAEVLYKMLNVLQGAFYVNLAERREKDETFIYGWFKHRVK